MTLSLGKLATNSISTKSNKEAAPRVPATQVCRTLVDLFISAKAKYDAYEGALKAYRSQLVAYGTAPFYQANQGKVVPSSNIVAEGNTSEYDENGLPVEGGSLLAPEDINKLQITFTNRYSGVETEAIAKIIGKKDTAAMFHGKLAIKLDGDKVPEDRRQDTIDGAMALFGGMDLSAEQIKGLKAAASKLGLNDSQKAVLNSVMTGISPDNIGEVVDAKVPVVPNTDFHVARHTKLTLEQNLELAEVIPAVVQLKKGK